jgi:superfamily II DNA helicase RecQ
MNGDSLKALEEQHYTLYRNLDDMEANCKDEDCRRQVWEQYSTARRNHDDCINKIFNQDDTQVIELTKECQNQTANINKEVQDLSDMVKVLKVVTAAVQVGTRLASLAV